MNFLPSPSKNIQFCGGRNSRIPSSDVNMFPSEAAQNETPAKWAEDGLAATTHKSLFCLPVPSFLILKHWAISPTWSLNALRRFSPGDVSTAGLINSWMCSKYSLLWSTKETHPRTIVVGQDKRIPQQWDLESFDYNMAAFVSSLGNRGLVFPPRGGFWREESPTWLDWSRHFDNR